MTYYAHTHGEDQSKWQPLKVHLENVANLAKRFAEEARPGDAKFAQAAYAAGLLHDVGKYRPEFQRMIRGKQQKGESTRHKQAGAARAIQEKLWEIGFAILGHHGGIPDAADMAEGAKAGSPVLEALWPTACSDFPELKKLSFRELSEPSAFDIDMEVRVRLLFSCLVDADWLDTSGFQSLQDGWEPRPPVPALDSAGLLPAVLAYINIRASQCHNPEMVRIRSDILNASQEAASARPGVFSMTVPTGGGKTLSSLVFALKHAAAHGMRRIVYVAPYLSIIEQNAEQYRKALGFAADGLILEHHSLAEPGDGEQKDGEKAESGAAQRLAENWDMPIILTTSVQFYESLFSNQPSRCRKMHNIARSVVILDECQTLPPGLTAPTCAMLEQACGLLGCSIMLCTATQPAWKRDALRLPSGIPDLREIAPNPSELFRKLKRVEVSWPKTGEAKLEWTDVAAEMAGHKQALCVVNTRLAALEVYRALQNIGVPAVHLSTNMCPAHRLDVLKQVGKSLHAGQPCRLVSTQLVEAGVDLDFPVVMREMAPLESIVQAAGRCNREGRLNGAGGRVMVFRSTAGKMPRSPWYKNGTAIVEQDFLACGREPRIDQPETMGEYYRRLYPTGSLDSADVNRSRSRFNFRQVADGYKIIDDVTTSLLITTWEPAKQEVEDLLGDLRRRPSREAYRRLQRFGVNVYEHELRQMAAACVIDYLPGVNICVLPYDDSLGLTPSGIGVGGAV